MRQKKSEKLKLYVVIGLLLVAGIVAYFRFIHKTKAPDSASTKLPPQEVKFDVSQIQKTNPTRFQPARLPVNEPFRKDIRDIFMPLQMPTEPELLIQAEQTPEPTDVLKLKGIIIGGNEPMAIINDKFVRKGEKIAGYQVVSIDLNEVVLMSGRHEKVLQVLTPVDFK